MVITPNIGLSAWPALSDYFSHTELSQNFSLIDSHSHVAGKGVQIPYGGLANQSVGANNIINNAITANQIANGAIGTNQIAAGGVTGGNIALNSVSLTQTSFYLEGALASLPAAGSGGRLYFATDTEVLYLDQVSAWTNLTPTAWTELTLSAGVSGGPAYVRLDPGGVGRFKGILYNNTSTTVSGTIATIPASPSGMRPTQFDGVELGGLLQTPPTAALITISTAGLITVYGGLPGTSGANTLNLDGLTYSTS